jgi:hypothetical protein
MLIGYFGPDPTLPLVSTVATVLGIALVTGRITYVLLTRKNRGEREI